MVTKSVSIAKVCSSLLQSNAMRLLVYTSLNLLHRDGEVQSVDIANKFPPVSIAISIISTLLVGATTNASLVEVVGRVCWVHYARNMRKQDRVGGYFVVFFPIDARTDNPA